MTVLSCQPFRNILTDFLISSLQLSCFGTSQLYQTTISPSICTNADLQNASPDWFGFVFLLWYFLNSQVRQKLSYSDNSDAFCSQNDPCNGSSISRQLTSSPGFPQWLIADLKSSFSSFDSLNFFVRIWYERTEIFCHLLRKSSESICSCPDLN